MADLGAGNNVFFPVECSLAWVILLFLRYCSFVLLIERWASHLFLLYALAINIISYLVNIGRTHVVLLDPARSPLILNLTSGAASVRPASGSWTSNSQDLV